jgi:hypothetical protein
MLLSRHYLIIVPCILIADRLNAGDFYIDDPVESFLNKTSLTHQALIKATKKGDVDTVMQLIKKQPDIIGSTDSHGNTLLTIASLQSREELVKRLAQAGARLDFLEYTQIWGILDRTPQSACAKRILSFLRFIRSEEFLLYHNHRLQLPAYATLTSVARVPKIINTVLSCLRNAFYTSVDNAHDIEHDTVAVPHPAHAEYINTPSAAQLAPYVIRLYAATLDNNHTEIKRMLETNRAHVQDMILASAASIATRECNNHFLALYILLSGNGTFRDIFFKKVMDAPAHN